MSIFTDPWFPGFITGSLALLGVALAAVLQTRREKLRDREAIRTPAPPTTQQVWERLDRVEVVLGSAIVLLSEVADQWKSAQPPVLSKRNVDVIVAAGYMPPEWDPTVP